MEVRLHNCDCMAFMADIPNQYYERRKYNMPHWETPTESYFHELFRVSKAQIIWGINYFPICPGSGRIVWDKCCDNGTKFSDCEIAYCSLIRRIRIFRFMWNGMLQGKSMTEYDIPQNSKRLREARIHPTQKPVTLYKWIFREFVKEGDKVLDTHGGSMSSAIAAYDFGDGVFDLCEIDPAYFAAGKQRFEAYSSQGKLF